MLMNEIMPYYHQNSYRASKLSISPILIISQIKGETKPWIQKNLYPRLCPPDRPKTCKSPLERNY